MKKFKEIALWYALKEAAEESDLPNTFQPGTEKFLDVIERLDLDHDQARYYLTKWTSDGLWSYGVTPRSGWFTDKGWAAKITRHEGHVV